MDAKSRWRWIGLWALLSLSGPAAADEQGIGDVVTGLLALGTIGSTYCYDDSEGRWMLVKSTAVSYGANGLLRLAFNDTEYGTRPNGKGYGFPSGHIGFMTAGAAFLQERYGWKWGVPGYLATGYVAYVRVEQTGHHRWRDVVAAVALAQGVAWWLVEPHEDDPQVSVAPMLESGAVGTRVTFNW